MDGPRPDKLRKGTQEGGQAMVTIGLDISKSWFQIHWITADGEIIRKKLARGKVLDFFSRLPSCLVGLEALRQRSSLGS
jgi:transposase